VVTRELAVVGELNNAYNDGTRGKFTYSRNKTADTHFGIALSSDSGDSWNITGEKHIDDRGSVTFPRATRRYARRLKSLFEFTKYQVRNSTCAEWDIEVRATAWIDGSNSETRQKGTLDRCDPNRLEGFEGGAEFHRFRSEAVRWTKGVQAFGVYLTTRSGFSENVTRIRRRAPQEALSVRAGRLLEPVHLGPRLLRGAAVMHASATSRPTRRRWLVALAVLLALAAVLTAARELGVGSGGEPSPGPLEGPEGSSLGILRPIGRTFGYGLPIVINTSDETAVLDRVAPVGAPPGLELVDTRMAGPERELLRQSASLRWPSDDFSDLHPTRGFRVEPVDTPAGRCGAEIVFALRATERARLVFKAVQVDYHVGDTAHRVVLDSGLAVCAHPRGRRPAGTCAAPVGARLADLGIPVLMRSTHH
jgi:hypothetical protein